MTAVSQTYDVTFALKSMLPALSGSNCVAALHKLEGASVPSEIAWLLGSEAPGENAIVPMQITHAALSNAKYFGNSLA